MKLQSTLLLLTGASVLTHGLNIGKRDEGGDLMVRQNPPAPQTAANCVELEGPDNCPDRDDQPERHDDNDERRPDRDGPDRNEKPGPDHKDEPPPPQTAGKSNTCPRYMLAKLTETGAAGTIHDANCVEVDGPDNCPDHDDDWDERQEDRLKGHDGDRDLDGVPNWQDTTDDRPRRADGTPLPVHCWENPPPQREGDPPRPVCTDEDREGRGRDRDWDDDDDDDDILEGPGRGGRDGDRDYDGIPNWQDTTDDSPRRADGSRLPPQCWENPPPLREGEPSRPACTDADRQGRAGYVAAAGGRTTGNLDGASSGDNGNANNGVNDVTPQSSVRQIDRVRSAAGRHSVPVLGGVAGLAIAMAGFM